MNVRLSYNDLQLFMAIVNSLPDQAKTARNRPSVTSQSNPLRYHGTWLPIYSIMSRFIHELLKHRDVPPPSDKIDLHLRYPKFQVLGYS